MNDKTVFSAALTTTPGMGPRGARLLLREFDTLQDLAEAAKRGRLAPGFRRWSESIAYLSSDPEAAVRRATQLLQLHEERGIGVVSLFEEDYPPLLRLIEDAPTLLFWLGGLTLAHQQSVAVVGTRNPTPKARMVAHKITSRLVNEDYVIVSGLAEGIDTEAHVAALDAEGGTVAVVGTPLDQVFPRSNVPLQERILERGGCVISELPLGHLGHRSDFAKRDRIQSGLSVGVIPVQTSATGGTMHTVRYAAKQGRLLICPRPLETDPEGDYGGVREAMTTLDCLVVEDASDYGSMIQRLRAQAEQLQIAESAGSTLF